MPVAGGMARQHDGAFSRMALLTIFFFSGAAALIYQVAYARALANVIGIAAHAQALVLAIFMGGLALGAWGAALLPKMANGLRVYAWLEASIGAYALLFMPLLTAIGNHYMLLAQAGGAPGWLRDLACGLVLLPPVLLMGATLPILTDYCVRSRAGLRRQLALLYAVNAAGAVVGTAAAGFVLLERYGLAGTLWLTGGSNVMLGLAALLLARQPPAEMPDKMAMDAREYPTTARRVAVAAALLSGFVTLGLEVAYLRYFALVLGGSTYTFSLILMSFIAGLALGAWWLACRKPNTDLRWWLTAGFWLTAMVLTATVPWYDRLPYWLARWSAMLPATADGYLIYRAGSTAAGFVLLFVPALTAGMVFPAAVRIAAGTGIRRSVGMVSGINTIAAVCGTLVVGFVLFPLLGLQFTFYFLTALAYAGAILTVVEWRRRALLLVAVALPPVLLLWLHAPWSVPALHLGIYRRAAVWHLPAYRTWRAFVQTTAAYQPVFLRDGSGASVAVLRKGDALTLHINGKADAGLGDELTQRLIGHLPALVQPLARRGLVIGMGCGATAAALAAHDLARIDIVELHAEVLAASRAFAPYYGDLSARRNLHLHVDDALHFLRASPDRYDLIVSEPTNPWQAGGGCLFTREYYQLVHSRLAPGGVFCQFLPTYETSDEVIALLLRTLLRVFPRVAAFAALRNDVVLLAGDGPLVPTPESLHASLARPEVSASLRRAGIDGVAALAALHCADATTLHRVAGEGEDNTLSRPLAEFLAPAPFWRGEFSSLLRQHDLRYEPRRQAALWWDVLVGWRGARTDELSQLQRLAKIARDERMTAALAGMVPPVQMDNDTTPLPVADWQRQQAAYLAAYAVFRRPDPTPALMALDCWAATDNAVGDTIAHWRHMLLREKMAWLQQQN